jgi:hypothetical protein
MHDLFVTRSALAMLSSACDPLVLYLFLLNEITSSTIPYIQEMTMTIALIYVRKIPSDTVGNSRTG